MWFNESDGDDSYSARQGGQDLKNREEKDGYIYEVCNVPLSLFGMQ